MSEKMITIDLDTLNQVVDDRMFKSHSDIAKSVSNFGADLKRALTAIDKHTAQLDAEKEHKNKVDTTLLLMQQSQGRLETDIKAILTQTTKTNGRVTKLERWQTGVIASTTIVLGIAIYLATRLLDLQNTVSAHVGTVIK